MQVIMQKLKTNYNKIRICKTKLRDKNNCEQIFIETLLYQRIDCCNKDFMNLYAWSKNVGCRGNILPFSSCNFREYIRVFLTKLSK